MARARKRRTAAQRAATAKMIAANKARRRATFRRPRIIARRAIRRITRRRPPKPSPIGVTTMARRRFARRPASRRSARRGARRRRGAVRAGRRGFMSLGALGGLAGVPVGLAAALGGAAVLNMAANMAGKPLPQVVKDYAPLAGAGVIAGLAYLAPKFRNLTVPALIGGAIGVALQMYAAKKAGGAGAYSRLRGAGAVQRVLTNSPRGASGVARVLTANAAA